MSDHLAAFIDGLVTAWYSTVARWQPPGSSLHNDCALCVNSEIPDLLGLREWPHSATHLLVADLTCAAEQTEILLDEVGQSTSTRSAIHLFHMLVARHATDVRDVLTECLEPRLADYLAREAELGLADFERLLTQ